jgi:hypothetical protein
MIRAMERITTEVIRDALASLKDMREGDKGMLETQHAMLRTTDRTRRDQDQLT